MNQHLKTINECEELQPPISFEDYYRWGFALLQVDRFEDTVDLIERALQQHPDEASREELLLYQGEALLKLGKAEDATRSLEKAVRIDPEAPELWAALGDSHRLCGAKKEAREAYETALRISLPGEEVALRAEEGLRALE